MGDITCHGRAILAVEREKILQRSRGTSANRTINIKAFFSSLDLGQGSMLVPDLDHDQHNPILISDQSHHG